MSTNLPQPSGRDPLQTLLEDTERELRNRLRSACEAEEKGHFTETTAAIRRLEDDLLAAAVAVKQTIAVRSHMKRAALAGEPEQPIKIDIEPSVDRRSSARRTARPAPLLREEREVMGVREFSDGRGRPWRAWAVVPGLSGASGGQFLGDFQTGWICFESLGTSARRRLPYPRSKWPTLSDDDLRRLLDQAIDAPLHAKKP